MGTREGITPGFAERSVVGRFGRGNDSCHIDRTGEADRGARNRFESSHGRGKRKGKTGAGGRALCAEKHAETTLRPGLDAGTREMAPRSSRSHGGGTCRMGKGACSKSQCTA